MKKISIILLFIIINAGCTAKYNLEIKEDKSILEQFSITVLKEELVGSKYDSFEKLVDHYMDGVLGYNKKIIEEGNSYSLNLKRNYNNIELLKTSKVLSAIFSEIKYENLGNSSIFSLQPGYFYSQYYNGESLDTNLIENAVFTIKIENVVLESNADVIDSENGIYQWIMPLKKDGLYIKYDNNEIIKKSDEKYLLYVIIGGSLVLISLIVIITIYGKNAKNNEI